jgi:sporulation protein YabP
MSEISIKERESLLMTDAREVLSFDSDFIEVMTSLGKVEIEGEGLKILSMSSETGALSVIGRIDGVYYPQKLKAKGGIFAREK